jgi:hypothetical protein
VPHREVRHAAPEPGGYEPIIQSGWRTSALMRIPDSHQTSREVRKVPEADIGHAPTVPVTVWALLPALGLPETCLRDLAASALGTT